MKAEPRLCEPQTAEIEAEVLAVAANFGRVRRGRTSTFFLPCSGEGEREWEEEKEKGRNPAAAPFYSLPPATF
jgi:hypothetical protein